MFLTNTLNLFVSLVLQPSAAVHDSSSPICDNASFSLSYFFSFFILVFQSISVCFNTNFFFISIWLLSFDIPTATQRAHTQSDAAAIHIALKRTQRKRSFVNRKPIKLLCSLLHVVMISCLAHNSD